MEMLHTNLQLVQVLREWDPLGYGSEAYDTEVADSIAAVHDLDDEAKLALKLQGIYEFSFEEIIPIEQCLQMARRLLAIKNESSCSI